MKFPLKSEECSEMNWFTLLPEQATNQLPSAGIIRAPPVSFRNCSATATAAPRGGAASGTVLQCHVLIPKSTKSTLVLENTAFFLLKGVQREPPPQHRTKALATAGGSHGDPGRNRQHLHCREQLNSCALAPREAAGPETR